MPKRKQRRDQDGIYERSDSPYYWASYIDASGQRARRSTGIRKSVAGRKEAEALLAKWRLEAHQEKQWDREPRRSFEDVMVAYLRTAMKCRSADTMRYFVKQLRASFAGVVMNDLKGPDIAAHIARRRADGIKDSSINRELEVLSAAINHARHQLDWDLPNPVSGRMLKEPEGRVRWITREEARRLLDAAGESRSPYLVDLLTVALNTGMRREEMLGLEWRRVDLQAGLIHLEAHHTKSGKRRSVPLNQSARRAILSRARFRAEHCPASPWVFCKQNGKRIEDARKGFLAACAKVGIEDFHFHDLRHTCAAWLVSAGVPLSEVRDLLGHSTITMTERYAHLAPERVRCAVAVLDEGRESRSSHVVNIVAEA
jgi:integrase